MMKAWLPALLVGAFFLVALLAEHPSRLDKSGDKKKQELLEIEVPDAKPPVKEPEPVTEAEMKSDLMAELAPESMSSDTSLMAFGQGFGEGGGSFGTGSLTDSAQALVGEKTSVDKAARVLQRSPPEYPAAARGKGVSGEVLVRVKISTNGSVEEAKVEKADPPGIFEESALKAVRSWRFEPAIQKGAPVAAWLTQKIRFELN
jgi:protein TonB